MKQNPAIKMAMWMILLLAVVWLVGWLMGYDGHAASGLFGG
jgi:lipopolysaccharide export system protein LptC